MADQRTVSDVIESLHADGVVPIPDALPRDWAAQLDEDLGMEFVRASSERGGTSPRGWNRFYFEPYPERLRGFVRWVTHPLITGAATKMFGSDYRIVELGCDVPLPGAPNQPWHRDFPTPEVTRTEGKLTSFAVNTSGVDVADDMGPLQVVKGSHLDEGTAFDRGLYPPPEDGTKYEERMTSLSSPMGGLTFRTGLAVHRGSASAIGSTKRQVAVLGVVSPEDRAIRDRDADPAVYTAPRLRMSREFLDGLDEELVRHLSYEVVSETTTTLPPHVTHQPNPWVLSWLLGARNGAR